MTDCPADQPQGTDRQDIDVDKALAHATAKTARLLSNQSFLESCESLNSVVGAKVLGTFGLGLWFAMQKLPAFVHRYFNLLPNLLTLPDVLREPIRPLLASYGFQLIRVTHTDVPARDTLRLIPTDHADSRLARFSRLLSHRQEAHTVLSPRALLRTGADGMHMASPRGIVLGPWELADLFLHNRGISWVLGHEVVHARGAFNLYVLGKIDGFCGSWSTRLPFRFGLYNRHMSFDELRKFDQRAPEIQRSPGWVRWMKPKRGDPVLQCHIRTRWFNSADIFLPRDVSKTFGHWKDASEVPLRELARPLGLHIHNLVTAASLIEQGARELKREARLHRFTFGLLPAERRQQLLKRAAALSSLVKELNAVLPEMTSAEVSLAANYHPN